MKNKFNCDSNENHIFISPHPDDAILSCGSFICELKAKCKAVHIITVYSSAGSKGTELTSIISKYVSEDCNCSRDEVTYGLCQQLSKVRKKEDINACSKYLKCELKDLDFPDAMYRKDQNGFFYKKEGDLYSTICERDKFDILLSMFFQEEKMNKSIFYFPMGIGGHVDHRILKEIGLKMLNMNYNIAFYGELPYWVSLGYSNLDYRWNEERKECVFYQKKIKAIKEYSSQLKGLFNNEKVEDVIPQFELFYTLGKS